jgi:glycosyltransferase involved in cell wall biosynthesis
LTWINNETIDYKGFVNDVRPMIDASSCIVLPSYREGMPRIILEAMSMSKPIITTDTAGCRETVLEGKNGYLAKIKDEASLIHAMEKFINLPEIDKLNMGKEGRILAETVFSDVTIANHIYEILFHQNT